MIKLTCKTVLLARIIDSNDYFMRDEYRALTIEYFNSSKEKANYFLLFV